MALNFCDFAPSCEKGINKLATLDLTLYEKLQLFIHAENEPGQPDIQDGDLTAYIKIGKDLVNHYYEYEIPLKISDEAEGSSLSNLWPDTNQIDVKMEHFKLAKKLRIEQNIPLTDTTIIQDPDRADALIKVKGTPSLGYIKIVEIGIRNKNKDGDNICGEVWVNELRAVGLNEKGGYAAQARMQVQMADLGELNLSGSYSSIGWGSIDQRLNERNREELVQYDLATSLQLGKFFPEDWGVNIPFYAQYSKNTAYQQFEPYERDLTVDEKIDALEVKKENFPNLAAEVDAEIEDVKDRSKEETTIKTYNFTNVKKNGSGKMPWSVSNFSASYAYTETNRTDAIIEEDRTKEYRGTIDYNYNNRTKPIEPFKGIKSKALKIIKEINFNPLPSSFTFSTTVNRQLNTRRFRLPDGEGEPVFQFDDKRFEWQRNYGLNWDFTKSLRFNFRAKSLSIVDELRQKGIANDPDDRIWVDEFGNETNGEINYTDEVNQDPNYVDSYAWNNIEELGRSKNYSHNLNLQYTLPLRYLPGMDWINIKADYKGDYNWIAGSLIQIDTKFDPVTGEAIPLYLGNTIQNGQTRSVNGTFSFDKLYRKSKYLQKIEKGNKSNNRSRRSKSRLKNLRDASKSQGRQSAEGDEKEKKERDVTLVERILIRPLLLVRSVKATYKETFGTMIPGFTPEAELLGLSNGFAAPGLDFAAGIQPDLEISDDYDNWLERNKQWFNESSNFNDEISQNESQSIGIKVKLEPVSDFDVDIDFNKNYRKDHTEVFKFYAPDQEFRQFAAYDIGSFEYSSIGFNTLFRDNIELYEEFLDNRLTVSNRLDPNGPTQGEVDPDAEWPNYKVGYGPNSYDVAIPAFMATYLGKDVNTIALDIEEETRKLNYLPMPNWNVSYDGLGKMDAFKDVFSSFTINHAYKGGVQVNRFNTTLEYKTGENVVQDLSPINDNYYSRIQIPQMVITDQFAPIIGVSLKTKGDFTFDWEWRKSRNLALSLEELREQYNSEFRIGFGYIIKNFRANAGKKKRRTRRGQEDQADDDKNAGGVGRGNRGNRGGVNSSRGKTLTINFDFSITDSEELIYEVSQGIDPITASGQRTLQIAPSVDYDVNENLTMKFFFNLNNSESKATSAGSTRRLNIRGGVTAQLKIN